MPCPANFYKRSTGLYECAACPANAVSDEASTSIGACACNTDSGYSGGPILSWCDQCMSCSATDSCIAGAPPPVAIIFTGNAQKVSPTAQVLFQSSGTQNSTLQWSGSRLLSDCNVDPLERQLEFGLSGVLASSSVSRNLVFAERKLVPGGSYRIRLQATTGVVQSTAELLFTVNTLPENGTVRVVPSLGTAMENAFVISSNGW